MLKVYAEKYVYIGTTLQRIRTRMPLNDNLQYPKSSPIDDSDREYVHAELTEIRNHCESLQLETAFDFLGHYLSPLEWTAVDNWDDMESVISNFEVVFSSELRRSIFLFVLPHRCDYYTDAKGMGKQVSEILSAASGFPDAKYDITEAGNCLAFERFTACVYHLMRAAEYGLLGVAASIGVPEEKCKSWEKMIGGINGKVDFAVSNKSPNYKETQNKYGDLCSWFTTIKNGWRNPVSHVPRTYSEDTAKSMFSALGTLFKHLTQYGIGQAKMPPEPIALPSSEGE
jgi:hypothetical protein